MQPDMVAWYRGSVHTQLGRDVQAQQCSGLSVGPDRLCWPGGGRGVERGGGGCEDTSK